MRPIRIHIKDGLYHITTRCNNQRFYFREDEDFSEYLKILAKAREKYSFKIHAYCLTSNHTHLLISTPEANISRIMQYINGEYAKNYNRRHKRTGHFWGERFYSTIIESERQYWNTHFYIELNMSRNGVTKHPKEWKWSSYSQHAKGKGPIRIDFHEIYLQLANSPIKRQKIYVRLMEENMKNKGLLVKKREITYGLILGSESFVKEILSKCTHKFFKNRKLHETKDRDFCIKKFKHDT